jgi:hypothetical protein
VGGFTPFLMEHAEIGGTANQVHASVQRLETRSHVATLASQARQPLSKRGIQVFDTRRIMHRSSSGKVKLLRLL